MNISTIDGKTVFPICINLMRSDDRLESIKKQMSDVEFPINFCEGVDRKYMTDDATGKNIEVKNVTLGGGDTIDGVMKPTRIRYKKPNTNLLEYYNYIPPGMIKTKYTPYTFVLYVGTIGCSLSHLKCFKQFDESGCDYALILEDDIDLVCKNKGFLKEKIGIFLKEEFDFFLMGTGFHRDYARNPNGYHNGEIYETAYQYYSGSSAYLLSRHGLDVIKSQISNYETVFSAADEFFGVCQQDFNCKILSTTNKVFTIHETLVETTIIDHA